MNLMKDDGGNKIDETLCRNLVGKLLCFTTIRLDIKYLASWHPRFMHIHSHICFGARKGVEIHVL